MKIEYEPSLYLPSKKPTQFKTLNGEFLEQKKFDSMRDAKDYIKQFEGVSNASTIYGNTRFEYAFIGDQHNGMIDWDQDNILIFKFSNCLDHILEIFTNFSSNEKERRSSLNYLTPLITEYPVPNKLGTLR